jgi:ribonucleoside-diphosphate reductase alpha chain
MEHQYYSPGGYALEVFQKRYAIHEHETFAEACDRVAYHVAQAERGENIMKYRGVFADLLKKNLFIPGGRITYGSGRPKGQLLNCFVIPATDTKEGWGKTTSDFITISMTGGGVGTNYSPLRPRFSLINGTGGVASGSVSLMRGINSFGEEIRQGGGRRVALMMALKLNHGDIMEFLDAKLDKSQLNNANVSVVFDESPEDFFDLVKKDAEFELKHNGKVIGKVKAKQLWTKIITNALKSGEPGILNGYLANKMSNIGYYKPLVCTNPCGEIWLIEYDCCDLGHLVLPRFVDMTTREIDWEGLKEAAAIGIRFLDNVLTVNNYPLPEIKETATSIRRVGLGVTGLHDMLLLLGLRYNSSAGLEMVDKVMATIKNASYQATIDLAKEKGPFPLFSPEQFLKGGFAKTLKPSLREGLRIHGARNAAVMTVAPVGTGSIVSGISNEIFGVTSGIEPMFAAAYIRRWMDQDVRKEEIVIHPLFKWFMDSGLSVKHFQGSHEIKLKDHFEMQRTVQKHVDNAVSKTINVPQGVSADELSELYMEYLPDLKGVTVYPEGSRENQPLTPMDLDEAIKHYKNATAEVTEGKCHGGYCEI